MNLFIKKPTISPKRSNALSIFSITIFGFFLLKQHSLVFPYHDDWGYSVLSYASEQTGFDGQRFTQSQLIQFLSDEYQNWSGRVFAFFIQINLFKLGVDYVRYTQVVVILAIAIATTKLSLRNNRGVPNLLIPGLYFCALPAFTLIGGLYWFSASISYVWGLALFLLGALCLQSERRLTIVPALLLATASAFHEQMSIAVTSFVFLFLALNRFTLTKRRDLVQTLTHLALILLAAAFTVLAPGNFKRKSVSVYPPGDALDIASTNANSLFDLLIKNSEGHIALAFIAVSFLLLCTLYFYYEPKKLRAAAIVSFALLILIISRFISPSFFLASAATAYGFFLLSLQKRDSDDYVILSIYIAAIAGLFLLLLAPLIAGRSLLTFYLLMMVPVTYVFLRAFRTALSFAALFSLVLIALPAFSNAKEMYLGYHSNLLVNTVNHSTLFALSYSLKRGEPHPESVTLYRLANDRFAETMPYQRPLIEKWMKKHYSIPQDVSFLWK